MHTNTHIAPRSTRAIAIMAAAVAALSIVLMSLLGATTPAAAHDQLVGSSGELTADGEHIEWTLQFNNEVFEIGAEIIATAADGSDLVVGSPVITGREVTQRLDMPGYDQTITMTWGVTSSDGHPISGQFAFAVIEVGGVTEFELREVPTDVSSDDATAQDQDAAAEEPEGLSLISLILIGGGIVLVVVGVVGVLVAMKRNRR